MGCAGYDNWAPAEFMELGKRLDNQFRAYQNRFLANELPEPDFKYFSKAVALSLSLNPRNRINSHGRYGFVNFDPPEL